MRAHGQGQEGGEERQRLLFLLFSLVVYFQFMETLAFLFVNMTAGSNLEGGLVSTELSN